MKKTVVLKRISCLILAVLLVGSICGCKKAEDDGSSYYTVESTVVTKKIKGGKTAEDGETTGTDGDSASGKGDSKSGSGGSKGGSVNVKLEDTTIGKTGMAGYVKDLGGRTVRYGFNTYFEAPDTSTKLGQATLSYYKLIEQKLNCKLQWNPKKLTDEQVLVSIMSGKPEIDIYMTWGISKMFGYAKKNYFEPLDGYNVVDFTDQTTYGADIQYGRMNGHYYGIPVNGAAWAGVPLLFYNKEALKKAGYTPEALHEMQQNGTWTWDTFQKVLEKVKAATGIQKPLSDGSLYFYNMLLAGAGADWVTADGKGKYSFTADSPKAVEAMNYYAKITQLGLVENVEAGDVTAVWYDINRATAGNCAFWVSWEGMMEQPTFPESKMWGCMYPPKKDASTSYVSPNTTIQFYSVCAGVEKPAEVLTVMSEMVKPVMNADDLTASRKAMVTAMVSDKFSLSNLLNSEKISVFFNTDFADAANIVYGENKDGWNYQVAKIASGEMALAQAVASYKKLYNNRLSELFK